MKVFVVVTVIIFLLLLYNIKFVYSFRLENFEFSAKVILKTPFSKEIFNTENPKKQKPNKKEEKKYKTKKKIDLKTVMDLKEPLAVIIAQLCGIIKRHCKITKMDTSIKVALEDPMENGIVFGIISGIFNIGTAILVDKCNVRNVNLNITSDFDSAEGLIFESFGTLKIRPLVLAVLLIFNFKLIKAIKNSLMILKREDIENG